MGFNSGFKGLTYKRASDHSFPAWRNTSNNFSNREESPTYENVCKPEEVDSREGNSIPATLLSRTYIRKKPRRYSSLWGTELDVYIATRVEALQQH